MSVETEIKRPVLHEDPNIPITTTTTTTKPLRIPISKIRSVKLNCNQLQLSGTASSIPSGSSSFDVHVQSRSNLISPLPIFTIDSHAHDDECSGTKIIKTASGRGDKMTNKSGSNNTGNNLNEQRTTTTVPNSSNENVNIKNNLITSFREGTSSGFSSDLDEDSTSSNSDIDSDTSDEPPLLWNFADFFAAQPGHDWCVRVPETFIQDEFNLFELPDVFQCPLRLTDLPPIPGKKYTEEYTFDDLLEFIIIEDLIEDPVSQIDGNMLEDSILLYKLIHQRYILTKAGLQEMWERFEHHAFGTCPRYLCHDQSLLPVGLSNLPNKAPARGYCLNCQDIYVPPSQKHAKMDGVPFGTTFPHFLIRTALYSNDQKARDGRKSARAWQQFVPKIYGFRIYKEPSSETQESPKIRSERPKDYK